MCKIFQLQGPDIYKIVKEQRGVEGPDVDEKGQKDKAKQKNERQVIGLIVSNIDFFRFPSSLAGLPALSCLSCSNSTMK